MMLETQLEQIVEKSYRLGLEVDANIQGIQINSLYVIQILRLSS